MSSSWRIIGCHMKHLATIIGYGCRRFLCRTQLEMSKFTISMPIKSSLFSQKSLFDPLASHNCPCLEKAASIPKEVSCSVSRFKTWNFLLMETKVPTLCRNWRPRVFSLMQGAFATRKRTPHSQPYGEKPGQGDSLLINQNHSRNCNCLLLNGPFCIYAYLRCM